MKDDHSGRPQTKGNTMQDELTPEPVKAKKYAQRKSFSPLLEASNKELIDDLKRRASACLINVMTFNADTGEIDYLSAAKGKPKLMTSLLDDLYDTYVADHEDRDDE